MPHRLQGQNANCKLARLPKSKLDFWETKLEQNRQRDLGYRERLRAMGWRVLIVWECELHNLDHVSRVVREFLGERGGGKQ